VKRQLAQMSEQHHKVGDIQNASHRQRFEGSGEPLGNVMLQSHPEE